MIKFKQIIDKASVNARSTGGMPRLLMGTSGFWRAPATAVSEEAGLSTLSPNEEHDTSSRRAFRHIPSADITPWNPSAGPAEGTPSVAESADEMARRALGDLFEEMSASDDPERQGRDGVEEASAPPEGAEKDDEDLESLIDQTLSFVTPAPEEKADAASPAEPRSVSGEDAPAADAPYEPSRDAVLDDVNELLAKLGVDAQEPPDKASPRKRDAEAQAHAPKERPRREFIKEDDALGAKIKASRPRARKESGADDCDAVSQAEKEALDAISGSRDKTRPSKARPGGNKPISANKNEAADFTFDIESTLGLDHGTISVGEKAALLGDGPVAGGAPDAEEPAKKPRSARKAAAGGTRTAKGGAEAPRGKDEFDADSAGSLGSPGDGLQEALAHDVEQTLMGGGGSYAQPQASGQGEIELDFSDAAGPADFDFSEPEGPGGPEGPGEDDLLSKVLNDLDRLGEVAKPARKEHARPAGSDDDFTQILSSGAPPHQERRDDFEASQAEESEAPESSRASIADKAIIDEAADDSPRGRGDDSSEAAPGEMDALLEAPADGKWAGGPDDRDLDDGPSKGEGGEGESYGDTTDDLIASLASDMEALQRSNGSGNDDTAEPNAAASAGEAGETGEPGAAGEVEAAWETAEAGEARAGVETVQSDTAQEALDKIHDEVMSRSKDVEQKLLDEIFGSSQDKFKADVKAQMDKAGGKGKSARPEESRRREGHSSHAQPRPVPRKARPGLVKLVKESARYCALRVAYEVNRPFARHLSPASRQVLGAISLCLIGTSAVCFIARLILLMKNR